MRSATAFVMLYGCLSVSSLYASDDAAPEQPALAPQLEPLRPLIGKTWKGEFRQGPAGQTVVDIMRWERALNGSAVRTMHSINDGLYGGETIYRWDAEKKSLTFHYFTTAGFMTIGTVTAEDGKLTTSEAVKGAAGGATEVRSVTKFLEDGTIRIKTEYFKDDQWSPAREVIYREAPDAKVTFK